MEEQRIGRMYLNLVRQSLTRFWDKLFGRGLRRSGLLPLLVIGALIVVPGAAWLLHTRGQFHVLKREIKGENQPVGPVVPRPGGADPAVLTRVQTPGGLTPEFLSVTVLPGLGMDVLQISAFLPSRGEVNLLSAPTVAEMAEGTGGNDATLAGGHETLEVPWSGPLTGTISPLGTTMTTSWRGQPLELPISTQGQSGVAEGGLLGTMGADVSQTTPDAGGGTTTGTFHATDFAGHWPSKTELKVTVELRATTMIVTVAAKNVGDQAEPLGIGWHPRLLIPSRNRAAAELRLPNGERMEMAGGGRGVPSGKMIAAGAVLERFQGHASALGMDALRESLVRLKPGLGTGPAAELRDPASGFGLRMTALSASIRALRMNAPAEVGYVSLGMQTNYDDPLGKEWAGEQEPGIAVLEPGQTLEWKVQLEIFPIRTAGR